MIILRQNKILLQIQWIYDEIKEEIKKYLEANGNENTAVKNLLGSAKAVHRVRCIMIYVSLKKQEKSQTNLSSKIITKRTNKI